MPDNQDQHSQTTERPTSIAWRLGYSAFNFGRNCAYEPDSQERKDWLRGYADAKEDFENGQ